MACVNDSLQLVDCGPSQEACRTHTLTVPSLSRLHAIGGFNVSSHARSLLGGNAQGCSHSRQQCEP